MAIELTREDYEHLVYLHKKCGWSVRALADRYGMSKSTVHRIIKEGLKPNEILNSDDGV